MKELQVRSEKDDERKSGKEETLKDLRKRRDGLEQEVKTFQTKEKIEQKIELLKQKKYWSLYEENMELVKGQQKVVDNILRKLDDLEKKKEPVEKTLKGVQDKKSKQELRVIELNKRYNTRTNVALKHTMDGEEVKDKIRDMDNDFNTMVEKEESRKAELIKLQKELDVMRVKYKEALERQGDKSEVLEAKVRAAEREMEHANSEKHDHEGKMRNMEYEARSLQRQLETAEKEEQLLLNTKNAKIETLAKNFQNGQDTVEAMKWLEHNRDQFVGHIYDPLLICIDVQNAAQNAKYLEYVIPVRELQAFAAENTQDANALMKHFRDVMKLRVNVITVDVNNDMRRYQPRGKHV